MGFLGGAMSGFADTYSKNKKKKQDDSKDTSKAATSSGSYFGRLRDEIKGSFKKGGRVKRTGNYKLHAGEQVLTKRQAKRMRGRRSKSR